MATIYHQNWLSTKSRIFFLALVLTTLWAPVGAQPVQVQGKSVEWSSLTEEQRSDAYRSMSDDELLTLLNGQGKWVKAAPQDPIVNILNAAGSLGLALTGLMLSGCWRLVLSISKIGPFQWIAFSAVCAAATYAYSTFHHRKSQHD